MSGRDDGAVQEELYLLPEHRPAKFEQIDQMACTTRAMGLKTSDD
jgi:hypothetical protein